MRPRPRPTGLAAAVALLAPRPPSEAQTALRPRPRPEGLAIAPATLEGVSVMPASLRPHPRPDDLSASSDLERKGKKSKKGKVSRKGTVCGDPSIEGEVLEPIRSKVKGCGVAEPVRITAVDGVRLSQPAIVDCPTALALRDWIDNGMRPAFRGRKVVELRVAAHYICRPRNNIRGNKISEHGHGKAIDISAFTFADGTTWTVADDYNKQIRKAYKNACGIFGTTLGPGSDGYHEDHLHFDTASYRSGPYCR